MSDEIERLIAEKEEERRIASEAWDRIRQLEQSLYNIGVKHDMLLYNLSCELVTAVYGETTEGLRNRIAGVLRESK